MTVGKKVILLIVTGLLLFAGCASYIISSGSTYEYHINAFSEGTVENVKVTCERDGIVKVDNVKGDVITFSAVKKGSTNISVFYDFTPSGGEKDATESDFGLRTTSFNTIINSTVFDFTGCRTIIFASLIYMVLILAVLIHSTRNAFKKTWYSYKNMVYVGMIIFLSIMIISLILQIGKYITSSNNFGFMGFLFDVIYSGSTIVVCLIPLLVIVFFFISISNASLLIHEGRTVRNILGVIIGMVYLAAPFAGNLLDIIYDRFGDFSTGSVLAASFIQSVISLVIVYFDCIFFSACICSLMASFRKPIYDRDFVIILGCGLKKDGTLLPLLKGRADKAIEFVKAQKENTGKRCVFVPSGGRGSDEIIAEGEAIRNYLVEQGIDENDILVENKSTTTLENMMFSKKLIDEKMPDAKVAFATTRYHLFRSGMYSNVAGLNAIGIGSKTKWYFWPNAFLREFVGVLRAKVKYHIITAVVIMIVSAIIVVGSKILFSL